MRGKRKRLYRVLRGRTALGILAVFFLVLTMSLNGAVNAVRTASTPKKHPIYSVETDAKTVALGINCAWDNADIPQLIDILDEYGVKASFFVVGQWCDRYPESVKALFDAGHEIGSHSDTHADLTTLSRDGILREVRDSALKIEAITGVKPILFRPPSGAYNNQAIEVIEQAGMFPIQWDCDSLDYRGLSASQMLTRIMDKLRNGSIMLFHSGAENTPEALPLIIEAVRDKGYEFAPVSELIHPRPYTVDFEGRQRVA